MIPYFQIPSLNIAGLEFHLFSILFALGFLVAVKTAAFLGRARQLPAVVFYDIGIICLISGVIGAHWGYIFFYHPEILSQSPLKLLEVWNGLSSVGGFLAAGVAVYIYIKKKKLPLSPMADAVLFGVANGMLLGRLGCFSAHDHPGRLSDFFLAVRFPQGARHDLGFYEAILWCMIVAPIWWGLIKKTGATFLWIVCSYSTGRFFLEFLRAQDMASSDKRIASLTPAQFVMIFLFFWGFWFYRRMIRCESV